MKFDWVLKLKVKNIYNINYKLIYDLGVWAGEGGGRWGRGV
jgi:hypothetical protein